MLGTLDRPVDALVDVDLSGWCDSELRETYISFRRESDRRDAFEARLLAAIHGRGIPAGDGAASTAAWVQWQTGQRVSDARMALACGKAFDRLPLTAKAWAAGEISSSAGRAICRGVRKGHEDTYARIEATLVGCAERRNLRDLDGLIAHFHARADALDDIDPAEKNGVHLSRVANRWALRGDLDALIGRTLKEALDAATGAPPEGDERSAACRRADGLGIMARFFLDHHDHPIEGGERPHITEVVGWADVRDNFSAALAAFQSDTAFAPADIRQLLCDARITRMILGPDGIPLGISHATYTPPPSLRRAVAFRDCGCRFAGCGRPASWSQAHHVEPHPGGPTQRDNLVMLCQYHHHLVHKAGWRNTFDGTTYTVYNGTRLIGSTRAPPRE